MKQSKYHPLELHLSSNSSIDIPMTFHEIEGVIGSNLPPSARKHRPWWSNNPSNIVITHAWLAAGYKTTQVDLDGESLIFTKLEPGDPRLSNELGCEERSKIHPGFRHMQGSITIVDDYDITKPACPEWASMVENPEIYNE
ncbi:MAG: hypothetical protein OXF73_05490 [Gammaproteobacteria bacterium]|nr:hypothetical protein [Gammaproteobacteria bacterium]